MFDALPVLLTLPDPFTTEQAIAAGLTQHVVERLVRNGDVLRVRRGLFRRPPTSDVAGERWMQIRRDHLTRARLALLAHPNHALSHRTAAVAFGWPVSLHPDALVHLTALTVEPRSRRIADRYLHHSDSIVNDVEMVDGLRVLTRDRTVADCLRSMRAASAVAIADAALRERSTTRLHVERVLAAQRRWLGRPAAKRSLRLLDPRRETWLESYSFVTLFELGIELPFPQVEVFDASYRFVGRVDGLWIADATVAEADGLGKYLLPGANSDQLSGRSAAEWVVAERRRERGLIDLGLQVVRWDTDEIRHDKDTVARRVRATRRIGDISRFRGHLRLDGAWLDLSEHLLSRESGPMRRRFAG